MSDVFTFEALRYDTGELVRVTIADGRIQSVKIVESRPASDSRIARQIPWLAPGLVDIQINGYGGQEFSSLDLTPERVAEIVRRHFAFGVTHGCPTLTTQSFEVMRHGVATIAAACERWPDVSRAVAGIHLEGPYFSTEDGPRGAHPAEHCRRPNFEEFQKWQEAAGGRVRLLTMSPEFDEAPRFIAQIVATGVIVAIGHTGATGAQIRAAVDAGARLSTHLGNGAHRVLRRHPNYLWDQLAEDRLFASLIVDGHHLPPEVVKTFVRAKSPARCLLVSDVSGLAGLPAGRYTSSGCELEILPDGRLVIAGQDQLLAGASFPIGVGVANVMRFADVDLQTAVDMASAHPLKLLGLPRPELKSEAPADLVLFDLPDDLVAHATSAQPRAVSDGSASKNDGVKIRATILGGNIVHGKIA
jgi:N-acetylglucosamine-6-phosphate deacetylase